MERLLNLDELKVRLKMVDTMILALALRRMHMAVAVAEYKKSKGQPILRLEVEDDRVREAGEWAAAHGLSAHFARGLEYELINESCKSQLLFLQSTVLAEDPQTEDERYERLKSNLLKLTERWALTYDSRYKSDYFATEAQIAFETNLAEEEITHLTHRDLMLDLGCAVGEMSMRFAQSFDRVIGYDISQHMLARAAELAESRELSKKVSFEQTDLEQGIPLQDAEASFVLMNLGTGGDMRNISQIVDETLRVLRPGGRFLFSFYNRDALVYRWELLPWPVSLAAIVNIHRDSLDVHSRDEDDREEILPVFARAYTVSEVEALFEERDQEVMISTHPTVSAVLPQEVLSGQSAVAETVRRIDLSLTGDNMGAYIVVRGQKK